MILLPGLAAIFASCGWAIGIVVAHKPARILGAYEFTRIQLLACAVLFAFIGTSFQVWGTLYWSAWPAFAVSTLIGLLIGNLAMIEALRQGGPRKVEVLLSMKAPIIAGIAYVWFGEVLNISDVLAGSVILLGVLIAILFGQNDAAESDKLRGPLSVVVLLGLTAAGCQGLGFLVLKPVLEAGTDPLAASAIRLLGGAIILSLLRPKWQFLGGRLKENSTRLIGMAIVPGVIGYGVSSTLLLYAFASMEAGIAAVLGSLSPVLVLPILWIRDKTKPRAAALIGALLCTIGGAILFLD